MTTRPSDSPPIDYEIAYEIDHEAEPGDVVAALAALLVEVDAEAAAGEENMEGR